MPIGREHRSSRRILADLQVHVSAPGADEQILMSHDWSERSVFLRTHAPLPAGTQLAMSLLLGHPAGRVAFKGVVVRAARALQDAQLRPLGMAVQLHESLPARLHAFLVETVRKRSMLALREAQVVQTLLLVSEDHPMRTSLARELTIEGYEVLEADNALGAALILNGASPRALIILEDSGELLAAIKPALAERTPLDAVIVFGPPPRSSRLGFGAPLVVFPRMWPTGKLPALLDLLLSSEPAPVLITGNSEGNARALAPGAPAAAP